MIKSQENNGGIKCLLLGSNKKTKYGNKSLKKSINKLVSLGLKF